MLRTRDEMLMKYEGKSDKDNQDVHLEIEFEFNDVSQDYEVEQFILQFISYFLHKIQLTDTSPSFVYSKKMKVKILYKRIAKLSIIL